ncbi:DnaB-like helicase C-terminal domain-containing protein [Helicobacter sp. L8]|uniref:DnaB-like helicase C-terminal domain-containing protein n=1 Tax=Helicobacter sp. L8 TaxID=2316078 RepID=UPI000EAB9160|nr:DnaB-like helicase C-terminal domain-containing protein [Helicobacter sp. L8]
MLDFDPLELERLIVHSVLTYPRYLDQLLEGISLKYFEKAHQDILEFVIQRVEQGLGVGYEALQVALGASFCASPEFQAIVAKEPQPSYLDFKEDLKHALKMKTQKALASQLAQCALRGEVFDQEFLDRYISLESKNVFKSFAQWCEHFAHTTPLEKLPSGIASLDKALGGGFETQSLVLIGGDPDAGKTMLGLQILSHISQSVRVAFFSFEFPLRGLVPKLQEVQESTARLDEERLLITDVGQDLEDVIAQIKARAKEGVKAFLIDSQYCLDVARDRIPEEEETRKFKRLLSVAHDPHLEIVIFLIVQSAKGDSRSPFKSKMGAHMAKVFLHIEKVHNKQGEETAYRKVHFIKNKQGGLDKVQRFRVNRELYCFEEDHESDKLKKDLEGLIND